MKNISKFTFLFVALSVFFCTRAFAGSAVDSLGNRVHAPEKGARIVCLSPGATETLYALGLRDEIIGVSSFCDYPSEFVKKKQKMGGFSTPNIEKIQSVSPHIIVLTTVIPAALKNQIERLGIQLFAAEPHSFRELIHTVEQFGKLFNRKESAELLIRNMEQDAARITGRIREKSVRPVKTFIEIWYDPYYGAERDTLPGDLVTMAGGRVVPNIGDGYVRITEEHLLELNPEAIILGHKTDLDSFYEVHTNVANIPAIKNRKVFSPDPDQFLRPGPRVIEALEEIARFLHPEAF